MPERTLARTANLQIIIHARTIWIQDEFFSDRMFSIRTFITIQGTYCIFNIFSMVLWRWLLSDVLVVWGWSTWPPDYSALIEPVQNLWSYGYSGSKCSRSGLPIVFRNIRRLLCASQMCTSFARTWTSRPFSDPGVGPRSCKKRLFKNKLLLDLCQEIKQHYFSQSLHESFNFQFDCQNFYAFQTNFFPMYG